MRNTGPEIAQRGWRMARGARFNRAKTERPDGGSAPNQGELDEVRERLLEALAKYPEAKQALRDALIANGQLRNASAPAP